MGSFLVPIIPTSMGMGAELTFPMHPTMTNGILMMTGQLCGGVFGLLSEYLASFYSDLAVGLFVLMSLIASISTIFIVEDLRRTNFSKMQNEIKVEQR